MTLYVCAQRAKWKKNKTKTRWHRKHQRIEFVVLLQSRYYNTHIFVKYILSLVTICWWQRAAATCHCYARIALVRGFTFEFILANRPYISIAHHNRFPFTFTQLQRDEKGPWQSRPQIYHIRTQGIHYIYTIHSIQFPSIPSLLAPIMAYAYKIAIDFDWQCMTWAAPPSHSLPKIAVRKAYWNMAWMLAIIMAYRYWNIRYLCGCEQSNTHTTHS